MAIAFRAASSGTEGGGSGSTTATMTKPTGTADGDLMVAVLVRQANGSTTAVTPPSGWTLRGSRTTNLRASVYLYTKVAASEAASWQWSWSGTHQNAWGVMSFSGDPTYKAVATSAVDGNTSLPEAPSIAGTAGDILVAVVGGQMASGSAPTFSPPSGMAERVDQNSGTLSAAVSAATVTLAATGATGAQSFTCSNTVDDYLGVSLLLNDGSITATGALASVTVAGYAGAAAVEIDATGGLAAVDVAGKDATLGLGTTGALASVDVEGLTGAISSGAEGQGQAAAITVVGLAGTYGLGTLGAVASVTVGGFAGAATFVVSAAGALATVAVQSFAGLAIRAGGSGRQRPGAGRFVSPRSPSGTFQSMKSGVGRFFGPRGGMGR